MHRDIRELSSGMPGTSGTPGTYLGIYQGLGAQSGMPGYISFFGWVHQVMVMDMQFDSCLPLLGQFIPLKASKEL
jgi:hypothetical protein